MLTSKVLANSNRLSSARHRARHHPHVVRTFLREADGRDPSVSPTSSRNHQHQPNASPRTNPQLSSSKHVNSADNKPNRAGSPMPTSGGVGHQVPRRAIDLLTRKEVAKLLRVSLSSVRRYTAAGLIKYIRLPSGLIRYRFEDIEEFIKNHVRTSSVGSATYRPQRGERGA